MRLSHAIFHTPLEPTIETAEIPAPANYAHWEAGVPERLTSWRVQDGELGQSVDYGLVSNPYGFEDSPDAEVISSGVNSKGPRSAALARHGNWFLWGFAGDPTQMTDSGRQVFLNSICWTRQFDGAAPLVALDRSGQGSRKPHRDMAFVNVQFLRESSDEDGISDYLRASFPEGIFERTHGDPDALERYYRENLEWLRAIRISVETKAGNGRVTRYDREILDVDPLLADAKVSNRGPAFFDHLIERLRSDPNDADALDLADRYLPAEAPRYADALAAWRDRHRDQLFFSDVLGFRWFVAPESFGTSESAVPGSRTESAVGGGERFPR